MATLWGLDLDGQHQRTGSCVETVKGSTLHIRFLLPRLR
jgi:hypothetical protein